MKKYSTYKVDDFVADSRFTNWVLAPNSDLDKTWSQFLTDNPQQANNIEEAKKVIYAIKSIEAPVSQDKLDSIWQNIDSKTLQKPKFIFFVFRMWAAIVVIMLSLGTAAYFHYKTPKFKFSEQPSLDNTEAKIVLADGSTTSFEKEESEIEINTSGQIIVNNDTIKSTPNKKNKVGLNHVVMPYGKQTSLQLPDGTVVYVNAGSKFSFPSKFEGSKREVYLKGEALFDVAENTEKPFIVHTADMDIYVTGTNFNVSAYDDDNSTQTVLVSGAVSVSKPGIIAKKVEIVPGEIAVLDKAKGNILTQKVDPNLYTSWVHGYLVFKGEPLLTVVKKLERYYNQTIEIEDKVVLTKQFSGKLDINKSLESVLDDISFAAEFKVLKKEENKTLYIIKH